VSRYADTHVVYPQRVSEPNVDREAWAHEVARLIQEEAGGNKSLFARQVGLRSVKTVDRWLARSVNVSGESVRQVARALQLSVTDLLVKVGLLLPEDLAAPTARPEEDAEAIRIVQESDAPPHLKRQLLAHLAKQRAAHEQQRLAEITSMVEMLRAGGR